MEIILAFHLIGFCFALGYEWQIGPYSADRCGSAIPGWLCAVFWPVILPLRFALRLQARHRD
jgi:hypothetical protein